MLISTTHRFVFVHVGKNGGNAIAAALQPFSSPGYWSGDRPQKHWPAFKIKEEILLSRWHDYFSFAVVSHPWRWLHSSYNYIVMTSLLYGPQTDLNPQLAEWRRWIVNEADGYTSQWIEEAHQMARKTFEEFVYHECDDFLARFPGGQVRKWCLDRDGSDLVTWIINYNDLASEWPRLCRRISVPECPLAPTNPTVMADGTMRSERNYRDDYTPAMVQKVYDAFALDIARFNFTF